MTLVLVVEDAADSRDVLQAELENEGYFVLTTRDCERALYLLETHAVTPDIILLDMMTPNMSGSEFLQRKRAQPKLADIPVVLCTGLTPDRVRPDCDADVLLVVQKPYDVRVFFKVLGHLRRASASKTPAYRTLPPPPPEGSDT